VTRLKSRMLVMLACVSLISVLAACGGEGTDDSSDTTSGSDGTAAPEVVSLKVAPTVPGPLYWSFYWSAGPLGFYEEEGLDVEIIPVEASVPQAILAGQLDIGGVGSDFIPQGAELNELKWFMMTDAYLFGAVVPGDSELDSVESLAGMRIGINEPHDEFDAEFVLTSNGIERGDYELIPLGEAVPVAEAMLSGDVDAMIIPLGSSWVNINNAFPDAGFRVLESPGTDGFYNTGLITSDEMIAENRDVVVRFGRAIAKAIIWMKENPEATAEAVMEAEPSAAESAEEALPFVIRASEFNAEIWEEQGVIHPEIIQATIDRTAELGFIEESYDAGTIIDESLHEEIWNFDVEAVTEEARAARDSSG
jgi:NitT/TauT family transport system substrate-binding protein